MVITRKKIGVLIAFLLLFLLIPFNSAYAWLGSFVSPSKTWSTSNGVFSSYNEGAYSFSAYEGESGSYMNIRKTSGSSPDCEIQAQAATTIGTWTGTEYNEFGDRAFNWGGSSSGQYVTASHIREIHQVLGVGEVGTLVWGIGQINNASGNSIQDIYSDYILTITTVATTDSCYYTSGQLYNSASTALDENVWVPGSSNFVNNNGVLFGVPVIGENNELIVPDTLRVKVEEDVFGYIKAESLDESIYCNSTYQQMSATESLEDIEARAFQDAFCEYYGVDALSYDAALKCAEIMRYENPEEVSAQIMTDDARVKLASALAVCESKGCLTEINAVQISENTGAVSVSDYENIRHIVKEKLLSYVPIYTEDGVTVIGEYKFAKI